MLLGQKLFSTAKAKALQSLECDKCALECEASRLTQTVMEHKATLAQRGAKTTNLQQRLLETEWRPHQTTHKGGISEVTFFRGLPGENFFDWIKEIDLVARAKNGKIICMP